MLISVFLRALGFSVLLPFSSGLRFAFSLALAVHAAEVSGTRFDIPTAGLAFDFLIGFASSLPLVLLISASSMAGELIDGIRGQTIGSMYDASGAAPSSIFGGFTREYAWAMLLLGRMPEHLLSLLFRSYASFPAGAGAASMSNLPRQLLELGAGSLECAAACVVPFALCCLCVEAASGLVSRAVPGVSIQPEAFQVKSLLSLLFVYAFSSPDLPSALRSWVEEMSTSWVG